MQARERRGIWSLFFFLFWWVGNSAWTLAAPCTRALGSAQTLNFKVLETLLQKNPQLETPEDVLSCLPEEFRSQFLLLHASRGLHAECTSAQTPRVIFFNDEVKFVLSFIQPSTSSTECENLSAEGFEFDSIQRKFSFRRLVFSKGETPKISESNPKVCLRCHGSDPRPLFDPYFIWPGFFGSNDDHTLISDRLTQGDSLPPESLKYFDFLSRYRHEGLYRLLYWTQKRLVPRSSLPPENLAMTPYERPNAYFQHRVSTLNLERFIRMTTDFPGASRFLPAFLYAVSCVPEVNSNTLLWSSSSLQNLQNWIPEKMLEAQMPEVPISENKLGEFIELWMQEKTVPSADLQGLSSINQDQIAQIEETLRRWRMDVPHAYGIKYSSPDFTFHRPHLYRKLSDYLKGSTAEFTSLELHLLDYLARWANVSIKNGFMSPGAMNGSDGEVLRWKRSLQLAILQFFPEYLGVLESSRLDACESLAKRSLLELSTRE